VNASRAVGYSGVADSTALVRRRSDPYESEVAGVFRGDERRLAAACLRQCRDRCHRGPRSRRSLRRVNGSETTLTRLCRPPPRRRRLQTLYDTPTLTPLALRCFRQILTLISFVTVLFMEEIPRPLFDAIAMTYHYEWRAMSYALFMHEDYPPFDFKLSSDDDGAETHTSLCFTYPEHLERWKPLYKWFLAIPQYFVEAVLCFAAYFAAIAGFFAVVVTGEYPDEIRDFLVSSYRHTLRVEAYVGLLTDRTAGGTFGG